MYRYMYNIRVYTYIYIYIYTLYYVILYYIILYHVTLYDVIIVGFEVFLTQLLDIGFFHGDPHPGDRLNKNVRPQPAGS